MKVFELINDQGARMKEFELMASWPTWVSEVVNTEEMKNQEWLNITTQINQYYDGKGTEKRPEHLGLTKWDLVAVLKDQMETSIVWG